MEKMAPLGPVYQAGTLSGNPVSCAAGIESLKIIRENEKYFYQKLDAASAEFQNQVVSHVRARGYPVSVARAGSMLTIFFRSEVPKNYQEARQVDIEKFKTFFWSLLQRGVYYPPSAFEACFISSVHDESVLSFVTDASLKALDEAFGG
jgi:glutamate-1-semialdehyde 2,1-aminomutase